jgi:hypothetical protein
MISFSFSQPIRHDVAEALDHHHGYGGKCTGRDDEGHRD